METAARLYARSAKSKHVRPVALACHIGSQITDLAPLEDAFRRMAAFARELRAGGLEVEGLDLGGGLGVPYHGQTEPPSPKAYAEMVERALEGLDIELSFEPGRLIAGNAGVLLTRTIYVKGEGRKFLIVDAAMNDLLRPALYDAYHDIWPVKEAGPTTPRETYDVVGPICETGDTFAQQRELPEAKADDLFAFMTAGAYGAVMSSAYNSREIAPEVIVRDDKAELARRRMTIEDQLALEFIPAWLSD
jgi:diaminopimelate decarboxylase